MVAADEPRNVTIHMKDWSMGEDAPYYGLVCVTDMDGNPYYPTMHFQDIALPDGEYHAYISPFEDIPVQLLAPDSEYVQRLLEIDPSLTFEDQSMGFDFVVKDGKPDRELRFNFGLKDGKYNHMTVTAQDAYTGQPLAGVHFSLIANPRKDPRVIATGVSDETGTKTFDDQNIACRRITPAVYAVFAVRLCHHNTVSSYKDGKRIESKSYTYYG